MPLPANETITAARQELRSRRREKRYATDRAGAISRQFGRQRLDSFIRANARPLLIGVTGFAVLGVLLWLALTSIPAVRGFALGLYVAGIAGALYHWCVMASGSAMAFMGQNGEEWTNTELTRLRRKGWRVVSHIELDDRGDIDHVAVGPDGIIVIETKWTSRTTDLSRSSAWLTDAARQARRAEKRIAGMQSWGARADARITSLVVVWGPKVTQPDDQPIRTDEGVNVIAGEHLRTVLGDLGEQHLTEGEITAVYEKLLRQVDARDAWLEENRESHPPTLAELTHRWIRRLAVGFVGSFLAVLAINLNWWFFAAAAAFVALGLVARRSETLAPYAAPWLIGTQAITALVVVDLIVTRLR